MIAITYEAWALRLGRLFLIFTLLALVASRLFLPLTGPLLTFTLVKPLVFRLDEVINE